MNQHLAVKKSSSSLNLLPATARATGDIYATLAQHQRQEDWSLRELMRVLQHWAGLFDAKFKLDVPRIALCIEPLPVSRYGHFRPGHNGFGLEGEIALNLRYLTGQRSFADILATLLHEMLHAWQFAHGTPSRNCHHNAEFRDKARQVGLVIDSHGYTKRDPNGPLHFLLAEWGIDLEQAEDESSPVKAPGRSKLQKYSCGCTNVRVATKRFAALCLLCQREFKPAQARRPSVSTSTALTVRS